MAELIVRSLTVRARSAVLVEDANLSVRSGELVAIIGENGAGKSSLLRGIMGFVAHSGEAMIDGRSLATMPARERARSITWLPQTVPIAWPLKLFDAVALGRLAHGGVTQPLAGDDRRAVERAIAMCALEPLLDRSCLSLSGGEIARVHIARAIAGEAPVLLVDEPVAALDPRHRLSVMQLLRSLADAGQAIAVVLHDIELAARFADRIVAMQSARIVAQGAPSEIVTALSMSRLFGARATIDDSQGWPRPLFDPGPADGD